VADVKRKARITKGSHKIAGPILKGLFKIPIFV
jgi:hypothetical protein